MGLTSRTQWTALAGVLLAQHVAGLFYLFGLFSQPVKHEFNLTQGTIDAFGSTANLGGNVGIEFGLLLDAFGPQFVLLFSGGMSACSWYLLWASVHFAWPMHSTTWPLFLIFFFQGHAQSAIDTASIPTISRHFPLHRGRAIGLAKSFVGLSGALASSLYQAFFKDHQFTFVLFLSGYILVTTWSAALWVVMPPSTVLPVGSSYSMEEDNRVTHHFNVAYRFMYAILLLLFLNAIIVRFLDPTHVTRVCQFISVFACFGSLLYYLFGCQQAELAPPANDLRQPLLNNHDGATDDQQASNDTSEEKTANDDDEQKEEETHSIADQVVGDISNDIRRKVLKDYSFWEAMTSQIFWLHFSMLMTTCGSGLVLINNLGQLTEVVGIGDKDRALLVSMQSICNCTGRLLAGLIADIVVRRWRYPRPIVFLGGQALMAMGMLILSTATAPALYIGTAVVGLAYGCSFSVSPMIATEVYGAKSLGAIYTALAPGVSMGSFALATYLFSSIYDAHADPVTNECTSAVCVQSTFGICFGICLVSMMLCVQLTRKTKERYEALSCTVDS